MNNLFSGLVTSIYHRIIILVRWLKYARKKPGERENRFSAKFDSSFSNSLVKLSFDFEQLIYLKIAQVGTKLYNGEILLNAEKINYPLKIKAVTGHGIFTYEIPKPGFRNTMQLPNAEISAPFRMELRPSPEFKMPGLQFLFSDPKTDLSFANKIELPKSNLKLKHKPFNTENFI